ncbi:hypothetical protein D3C81_1327390 [compost metagenome]
MDEGGQEAQAGEDHGQQRGDAGVAGVGQSSADRRGDGTDGADQGEDRDLALRQAMVTRQFQRHGSPEQAERGEHAALIKRALTQYRLLAQQRPQRADQLAIGSAVIRLALGHRQRQYHADRRHQCGSNHEHRAPTQMVGDHARHRPCQQNTQQQTAHDPADHSATGFFRRQVCRQRNQNLHRHRTEAHQQRDQQKHIRLIGKRRRQQAGNRHHGGDDHQPAVLQQITQRHQKEQAQRIANLRQRDDEAGHGVAQADIGRDEADDRLCVVDVGNDGAAAKGEQQHHASGHCVSGGGHKVSRSSERMR